MACRTPNVASSAAMMFLKDSLLPDAHWTRTEGIGRWATTARNILLGFHTLYDVTSIADDDHPSVKHKGMVEAFHQYSCYVRPKLCASNAVRISSAISYTDCSIGAQPLCLTSRNIQLNGCERYGLRHMTSLDVPRLVMCLVQHLQPEIASRADCHLRCRRALAKTFIT